MLTETKQNKSSTPPYPPTPISSTNLEKYELKTYISAVFINLFLMN